MKPTIIDQDTGNTLWRTTECAAHCGITTSSWRSYTRRGLTPEVAAHLDARTPLWWADDVRRWHAGRPGSPVPNAPQSTVN